MGGVSALAVVGLDSTISTSHEFVSGHDNVLVSRVTTAIEHYAKRGRISITFTGPRSKDSGSVFAIDEVPDFAIGLGVAWQLTIDGWQPALPPSFTGRTGMTYPASSARWPAVTVAVNGNDVTVTRSIPATVR